jgi:ubiquinone/menaquinone biosynthesis C-methylase UbiE
MQEPWLIDELAHAGDEHLDASFVAGFDEKQGRPDASADIALLVARGVDRGSTVVDLGAGTGQFALPAARAFGRVVAVDVSPAMLGVLGERAADKGLTNLECVRAGFLTYEHAGPPADAVHTRNALHQLPDFWKALALCRVAGMLRSGGFLRLHDLVYDCQPQEVGAIFADWFDNAAVDPAHGYTREDFLEHIRTEHSTFRWLLEPMLDTAGFDVESVEYQAGVYAEYLCVRR